MDYKEAIQRLNGLRKELDKVEEELTPKVKEGQYFNHDGCIYRVSETGVGNFSQLPIRAVVVSGFLRNHYDFFSNGYVRNNLLSDDEVEQALIEEFNNRYSKGDKLQCPVHGSHKSTIKSMKVKYESHLDLLQLKDCEGPADAVYIDGDWAEIIEDAWDLEHTLGDEYAVVKDQTKIGQYNHYENRISGFPKDQAEEIRDALNNMED